MILRHRAFRLFLPFLIIVIPGCGDNTTEVPSIEVPENFVDSTAEDSIPAEVIEVIAVPEPIAHDTLENRPVDTSPIQFQSAEIALEDDTFDLQIPKGWRIRVVSEKFSRLRFMAKSPDGRLFVTDMKNRSDNSRGKVLILDGFDADSASLDTVITYLDLLRNPNCITFHTDTNGVDWLYLALTDKLVRYRYAHGETSPSHQAETVATFPDYGLSYKYGGWHLTRTVAVHDEKLYVSVGSSCNVCEETEAVRASILEMNLDGGNVRHYAYGVRNAVGIQWIGGKLYTTNMGADHLGDNAPEEALYQIEDGRHYGWPYFYQEREEIKADTSFAWTHDTVKASDIPSAYATLGPHSAPLGFAFMDGEPWPAAIRNYFLVALHGSGHVRIGNGYNVVRARKGQAPEAVIDGWLQQGHRYGRPCDVFPYQEGSFFVTDDFVGVLYFVETSP